MNFLKTLYLAASLLGCVNLAAMPVPSDEAIKDSIEQIIQYVQQDTETNVKEHNNAEFNASEQEPSIPLIDIPGADIFLTWLNLLIEDIRREYNEDIRREYNRDGLVLQNKKIEFRVPLKDYASIVAPMPNYDEQSTIYISIAYLKKFELPSDIRNLADTLLNILLHQQYWSKSLNGISDESIEASIKEIIQHSDFADNSCSYSYINLHQASYGDHFIIWLYTFIQQIADKYHLSPSMIPFPDIRLVNNEKIDLSARSPIAKWDNAQIEISIGALKKLSLAELRYVIMHELGHIFFKHNIIKLSHCTRRNTSSAMKAIDRLVNALRTIRIRTGDILQLSPKLIYCFDLTRFLFERPVEITRSAICEYLECRLSRQHEYEADAFAITMTQNLEATQSAFIKAQQDHSDMLKGWRYELRNLLGFDSHPHYKDRIANMKKIICELKKQD